MAYNVTFFGRSGEENGSSALATFLSRLVETGDPVLIRRGGGGRVTEADVCRLATDNGWGRPVMGWLTFKVSVGAEPGAQASPHDGQGLRGSALRACVTAAGETDRPLLERIRSTVSDLWSAVARDETPA